MRALALSAIVSCLLVSAPVALSQATQVVEGVVVDAKGAAIAGALVQLRVGERVQRTETTDARGAFRFQAVPEGSYQLRVRRAGFADVVTPVVVSGAAIKPLRVTLAVAQTTEAETDRRDQMPANAAPRTGVVGGVVGGMTGPPPPPSAPARAPHPGAAQGRVGGAGQWGPGGGWGTPGFNTANYDRIDESGYRRVADHPLSTFSIDVDTASYSNVRRFLTEGTLPPADAVRIEELINYFRFPYAPPRGAEPFAVTTEVATCPWNPRHRLALVGLQTRPIEAGRTPPRNLVFLLDVSGSMAPPDRLPMVKTAMRMLTDTLTASDKVAIVVDAGASGIALRPTSGDRKVEIGQALAELRAGGSTNGAAGIRLAYDTAAAGFIKGGINRVILATDGDFNVGVTSQGELTRLIEEQRDRGIFLSVLGVGTDNLNDSTMEKLADRGNGNYAYLDSLHEARRVLIAEAGATLVTVAKDVKIQVEFNPQKVGAYRLIGYENRLLAKEDFNNDKKDAGEIGAGHSVTALYEIVPPGAETDIPAVDTLKYQRTQPTGVRSDEMMTVKLRYKAPDGDTSKLKVLTVNDRAGEPEGNLGFAAVVAEFGLLLRRSQHKGSATWASARERARRYRGEDPDGYRAEFVRLVDLAAALPSPHTSDSVRPLQETPGVAALGSDMPRGWLLLFCVLLLVVQPLAFAVEAAGALTTLGMRGAPAVVELFVHGLAAAASMAAGWGLWHASPAGPALATVAVVSAAVVGVQSLYWTVLPNSVFPSDRPLLALAHIAYAGVWLAYLRRSKQVRAIVDG